MLTQTEIAKKLKVSKVYIHKLVKKGMPITSVAAAKSWRAAHASTRQTTSPAQLAKLLADEANEDDSPATRARSQKYFETKAGRVQIPPENSFDAALSNAQQAADEAWRLLASSMNEGRDDKIGIRLTVFNKALEGYFKAEQAHREESERRNVLIPLAEAEDLARRGLGVIVDRLRCLPQNVAPRCNPTNAHQAMEVLESECNEILAEAQRVYAADAS